MKSERLARLQDQLNADQIKFNEASVGRVMPVLLERVGRQQGQLVGRSPYMQAVHVQGAGSALNRIVDVEITAGMANSLAGVVHGSTVETEEDAA